MNMALIMTAVQQGAVVANHVEVTSLEKAGTGKLHGARVRDGLTEARGPDWVTLASSPGYGRTVRVPSPLGSCALGDARTDDKMQQA